MKPVHIRDMIPGKTYIFFGANSVDVDCTLSIDTYMGIGKPWRDADEEEDGAEVEEVEDEYIFAKNTVRLTKDIVGYEFENPGSFSGLPVISRDPPACPVDRDTLALVYQELTANPQGRRTIGSIKGGSLTGKICTYNRQPYLRAEILGKLELIEDIYDLFTNIRQEEAEDGFCIYRTANITFGGRYGMPELENIYIPLPSSCTTELEFALNWGGVDSYIFIIYLPIRGIGIITADNPLDAHPRNQHEITIPAGYLTIVDRYYDPERKRFFATATFRPVPFAECIGYITSHILPPGVLQSNIGVCFDRSDPLIQCISKDCRLSDVKDTDWRRK